MSFIKTILKAILESLKYLLYKWIVVLVGLIIRLIRLCREYKRRKRELTRRERREAKQRCVPIKSEAYHKPDPLIYSQSYLMAQGLAVTWNNPDILLKKNGVPVDSNQLESNTTYQIEARVWNNSTEAAVVNMPVRFSFLSFGMGTTSNYIGETTINVGAKGSANHPSFTNVSWTTPAEAGHYCLQAQLFWTDDANPDNNLGQENTNIGYASSPAHFTFTLKNNRLQRHAFYFETDTYTIPKPLKCSEYPPERKDKREKHKQRVEFVRSIHNPNNFPVPQGWVVAIHPETPVLDPGEEQKIEVTITPPDDYVGKKTFNIQGFDDKSNLLGGVTLLVIKEK